MILTFCAFALFLTKLSAQIPNGGFENWTGNDPNEWVTTNALTILGNPQSIFKSTDAHTGSAACEINTIFVQSKIPGIPIPDYTGSVFTGKQIGFNTVMGFPYTAKPSMLRFWYKYNARNNDSASIVAITTKWNSSSNKRDTVSIGYGMIKDSVGVYTKLEINLTVLNTNLTPDTAIVLFASSTIYAKAAGAKLLVDDVEFAGGNVGNQELSEGFDFSIYPNPVQHDFVNIEFAKETQWNSIEIFNLDGKRVKAYTDNNSSAVQLTLENLSPGIYFIQINSENGLGRKRLIVE